MVGTIFSKGNCSNCNIIKNVFKVQGLQFNTENVKNLYEVDKYCKNLGHEFEFDDITVFPCMLYENKLLSFDDIKNTLVEPILYPYEDRYTLFPIKHDNIYQKLKQSRASFWNPEEIDFSKDYSDWKTLDDNTRQFIKYVLAFFAAADGFVLENLSLRFQNEVQIPEATHCYAVQSAIEAIHSETYSLLIDTYVKDPIEKHKLFQGVNTILSIGQKSQWVTTWINSDKSFAERLVAFACVEGIMFSGSFCAIFYLKHKGLMPGLAFANELISRDEGLHTEHGVELFHLLKFKPSEQIVHDIVKGAVVHEKKFIIESLQSRLIGMNDELMQQYIEFVADRLLMQLGYSKLFDVTNPFDWMEKISLNGKTNFFEKRVGEYQKSGVMTQNNKVFEMDDDF